MSADRVQKIIARAGVTSRRKAEDLIRAGRVTVNGQVVELGAKADPAEDAIKVDGKRVEPPESWRYFLLNKPAGCLTTRSDPAGRPTVFDLVPPGERRGLVAVGRLDYHTEGLLVLTDDGDFAHRVAHPRYGCTKTYAVKVKGEPGEAELERLRRGIRLEGRKLQPARIEGRRSPKGHRALQENTWWTVEIAEGRTRQVREMFHRVGHPVQRLRRVAIGPLRDPHLPSGALRPLSEKEVEMLRAAGRRPRRGRRGGGAKKGS